MSIKVKQGGAYADIVGAFVKQGGTYGAASVFAKVAGAYQAVGGGGAPPLPTVAEILATYGADAHMWIAGVGEVNGFDAENWLNSNFTGTAAVGSTVGSVGNVAEGVVTLSQGTAGSRPTLRQSAAVFGWEFDGIDDVLTMSAAPFSFPNDVTCILGATPTTHTTDKTLFSLRGATSRFEITHTTSNRFRFNWNIPSGSFITPPEVVVDQPAVVTCINLTNNVQMRVNGGGVGDNFLATPTFTTNQNHIGATNGGSFGSRYKGQIHCVILIRAQVTFQELKVLEQFAAVLSGATISQQGVPTYFETAPLLAGLMGNYTTSGARYPLYRDESALFLNIKAERATLFCRAGDTTPYLVMVDRLDFPNWTLPSVLDQSGAVTTNPGDIRKIDLFNGENLERQVLLFSENSDFGQSLGSDEGKLLALYGENVSVSPVGTRYYCADPAFPGVITNPTLPNSGKLPNFPQLTNGAQWSPGRHVGSVHFRARFTEMYIFCANSQVEVSVDGQPFQRYSLTPEYTIVTRSQNWRKLPITGNGTVQSVIISGSGSFSGNGVDGVITGVLLTGPGHEVLAPAGTRRHVVQFGASQTEGVEAQGLIDLHLAQDRLPIYALSAGEAGRSVRQAVEDANGFDAWAAQVTSKDILLISLGINDVTDDNVFQSNYELLISKALAAGFNRVLCQGLGFPPSGWAGRNSRIAAAVANAANPNVLYMNIDSWAGDYGPVGVHPTRDGYLLKAQYMVDQYASFFV